MSDATLPPDPDGEPRLHGYPWLPAKHHGGRFKRPPDLLVIHSASMGDNPAKYLHTVSDGRVVSAHISAQSRDGDFAQQVALTEMAWHGGGSVFQGKGGVNARSIGVELPAHEGAGLVEQWRDMVLVLVQLVPSLGMWTCHRWIKKGKTDPVPWDDDQCRAAMAGVGLVESR
tara:strand:+ start:346 stop:861 length:516 start_codon:yes stop_codon:yes gene_type:complete